MLAVHGVAAPSQTISPTMMQMVIKNPRPRPMRVPHSSIGSFLSLFGDG